MPRKARLDMPGLMQHVMVRGIEKRKIFLGKKDYALFGQYLARALEETNTVCYAWALLPNHFHLLVQPCEATLSQFMRRLLTRYAVNFNRRHQRVGHLFQNRYKSIVCDEETYLLELVRYIHLNPLRAGVVPDLDALGLYPWCGHAGLVGHDPLPGQAVSEILQHFGKRPATARVNYLSYVADGIAEGRRPELVGRAPRDAEEFFEKIVDRRVLGGENFLEQLSRKKGLAAQIDRKLPLPELLTRIAGLFGLRPEELGLRGRQNAVSEARAVFCHAAIWLLGYGGASAGGMLRLGRAAVSRAARRGAGILMEQPRLAKKLERAIELTQ